MSSQLYRFQGGFSILVSVIIISAVALMVATLAAVIGLDIIQESINQLQAGKTFAATETCLEDALEKLKNNANYSGGTSVMGDVSCTVTVSGSGTARTVGVRATHVGTYTKHLEVIFDWSAHYHLAAWRESID